MRTRPAANYPKINSFAGYAAWQWSVDRSSVHELDAKEHHLWLKSSQTLYGVESAALAPGYNNIVDSK
jgi:hypothetical protein